MAPISPTPRSTTRGRPRVTSGAFECSRCHRMANKLRVYWPEDQLCHSCFYTAMRTHGICPTCGHDGVLPGRIDHTDSRPVCLTCAGIPGNFTCKTCGQEGELHRRSECARCALRVRSLLQHHGLLPERDEHLSRFEVWLAAKLDAIVCRLSAHPSNSSRPGTTYADCAASPSPAKARTARNAQRNKRSPRPSSS